MNRRDSQAATKSQCNQPYPVSRLSQYKHIIPTVFFLAIACIFTWFRTPEVGRPPLLLAVLDFGLLSALPFLIAFLAARSYVRQGSRIFALFGCAMVAFGMGGLLSGWGHLRYGMNFSVTVHNIGALLGGIYHLGGVTLLILGPSAKRQPTERAAAWSCVLVYSVTVLFLLAVSLLAMRGSFPTFWVPGQGPTLIRQMVLTVAGIAFAVSAILLIALHAQTRMMFLSLYANGLFLTAIGLGIILNRSSVDSVFSWTGMASQYVGSLYFIGAMLAGRRETRIHGTSLPDYLSELFRSHLDDQVKVRTRALAELNRKLQDESAQRRVVEGDLLLSREELNGVYDHSPVMMCILDADHQVVYANPAFSELVGVPRASLIGGLAPGVFGCVEGSRQDPLCGFGRRCGECEVRRAIEDTLATGRSHAAVEYHATLEREGTRSDAWFLSSTVRIPGRSGFNLLISLLDITDRKRTEDELRQSESLYRTFIDDSLQGFAIIQDGRIVLCNDALCGMSGYSKSEAYAMSPQKVMATIHADDRSRVAQALQQLAQAGVATASGVIRLVTKSGDFRWVEVLSAATTYRGQPALQLSYVNRTEQLKAEAAYHSLIDHSMNGMAILQDGRVTFANQALADICGYTVKELLLLTVEQLAAFVHAEDRGRMLAHISERLAGREAHPIQRYRLIHKSGDVRWVETQSVRVDHEGAPAVQVSYKDVSAERAAEEQLELTHLKMRNLAAHLLRAREEERRKVAQEVHDELGQMLVALKMDLHWLAKRLGGNTASLREKVRGTIELGEQAISTVQRIASDLRPRMLDDLGLEPALDWLCADFMRRTKITCKVTRDIPAGALGGNAATALYRFTQEALANVGRHSHADHAAVRLFVADGMLNLQIEDDGIGITPQQAAAPDSYGLIGLRERVEELGGSLSINGEPGFGTILLARIPLPTTGELA